MPGLALLLAAAGCAGLTETRGGGSCPVVPVASRELPGPPLLRTRMQIAAGEQSLRLETVAQNSDEGLVVLGFAPYGVRLFAVRQRDRKLSPEGLADSKLGQPALWAADVLHRVFWIQPPGEALPDGPTHWSREGERVTEWRKKGRIQRREFAREGAGPDDSERVSIDYPDGPDGDGSAGIEVRNPWCGYEAVVVPLDDRDAQGATDPESTEREST